MKKAKIKYKAFSILLLCCGLCLWHPSLKAQPGICQLACNDSIQVALGAFCSTEVKADDLLEGTPDPDCLGPLQVNIYNAQGNLIPTSPFVDDSYDGQFLAVEVVDLFSGNSCEGVILVNDNFVPALQCHNLEVSCGTDLEPMVPVIIPQPLLFNVLNSCASITIPVVETGNLVDLNVHLEVNHSNVGELSASLLSPAGTDLTLFDNQGNLANCTNADLAVTFDDQANAIYTDFENTCGTNPAISGMFRPFSPLANFLGEVPTGNWTFTLCNTSTINDATVQQISLALNTFTITIPFPLPDSALIDQTPAQIGTNEFTITNFDNCSSAILSYSDITEIQDCTNRLSEILYRTWTIEDVYGNTNSCTDTIGLVRLPAGSIALPPSYDDLDEPALLCGEQSPDPGSNIVPEIGWNVLPNGHPSPFPEYYPAPNETVIKWYGTGFPQAEGCETVSSNYTDVRVDVCATGASAACFKIIRTWNITEACTGQNYQEVQIIKVADKLAPQINGLADLTISTPSTGCTADWEAMIPLLSDNCNPATNLSYTLHTSTGTVTYLPSQNRYLIEDLPLGIHTITYTAHDCCGNSSSTTINLTVADQVPPTATCVSFLTSSVTINGTVRVLPISFDDESVDNCAPVYLKVIRLEDLLGTSDGSNGNQSTTTCDLENGDDSGIRFGNQIWFDDYVAFCCEDRLTSNSMVVLRAFDVNPGVGPVNPSRMRPGGDLHGHFNDCMSEVNVDDKLGPAVFCPADITLDCTADYTDLNITGMATGFDNCQLDTLYFTDSDNLNECGVGTVARVWTSVDDTGRSASCLQTITLEDNTDPIVTFPPSPIFVECGEEFDLSITGVPEVSDNCSLLGINRSDELHLFADSCLKKIVRVWTVMDFCSSNMYSGVQVIKIEDTTPPDISGTPSDVTVECDNIPPVMDPGFDDNCDAFLDIVFEENILPGACGAESIITRTWTASDNCLNSTVFTQTITIEDTTLPILNGIPADLSLECDQMAPPANPTASDNCDASVDISLEENTIPGSCANNFTLQRVWTATDDCGNTSQGTQQITFDDTTNPVFTNIPTDTIIECNEAIPATDALATDNCTNNPNILFAEETAPGICAAESIITRTWTATDACGNSSTATQMISIVDTTAPVLTNLPMDVFLECDDPLPTDVPTTSDNCDNVIDLAFSEVRSNSICEDKFVLTRTWTASDDCGNSTAHTQFIFVTDTTAPVFVNVPMDITLDCDGMPTDLTPEATDNCDPMVTVTFMEDNMPGCIGNTTITRTWMATDNCGNSAVVSQQITFTDTTAPMLEGVPADATAECDAVPPVPNVTAMDACDPMVQPMFSESRQDGPCLDSYTLTRSWTAMDDCGNVVDSVQVLTIVDTTPPSFDSAPQDVTLACTDPTDPSAGGDLTPPTASDNCDLMVAVTFSDETNPGACADNSGITRTWTATDNCGNTASSTQIITIEDNEAPILTGVPSDVTVLCDAIPDPAMTISATDNCDIMVSITFEETTTDSICIDGYTLLRRWIAEDNCGNQVIDTQLVVVVDTIAPLLMGIPGDTTVQCSAIPDPPVMGLLATDNCDLDVLLTFTEDTTNILCTDEYTLVRRWTAEDNCGNITIDSQLLIVIDTVAPSLINIPADLTVTCDRLQDTTSNMVVSATDNCDTNVQVVYTESPDGQCPNTFIIVRRWTATDNCGNVTTKQQLVQVLDTVPPVLTCPANRTVDIRAQDNITIFIPRCDTFLVVEPMATDNCADVITITNDSPFADSNIGAASGTYPIGVHVINFVAEDRCGNTSTCSTTITIRDRSRPTLLCSDVGIVLNSVDSLATLVPGDFISFLADCSVDTLYFTQPIVTDTLFFGCADLGQVFDVEITVIDTSGNGTSCTLFDLMVTLPPNDPFLCGMIPPPYSTIVGHISTEDNVPLEEVMVKVDGGSMNVEKPTTSTGRFVFGSLPSDLNYSVKPENDNNCRNGVTTLDLVLISRHLLGVQPLHSPYKMIAADVDNSGTINTFDIVEIQKLILYLQDNFPDNTSWRFVDADYLFPNSQNPFTSSFPEVCEINGLGFGVSGVDFVGVKTGDVNGNAQTNANSGSGDRSTPDPFLFFTQEQNLQAGQDYVLEIRAKEFNQLLGFQFTLDFDPRLLAFENIEKGAIQQSLALGTDFLEEGLLTASWHTQEPVTYDPDEVLFSWRFRVLAPTVLSQALQLNSELTPAEAYTEAYALKRPQLLFQTGESLAHQISGFELFPNRPNPFREETVIAFQLSKASPIVLQITDVAGRVLHRINGNYDEGYHEVTIASSELSSSGVLYYHLISEDQTASRKMVLIKR